MIIQVFSVYPRPQLKLSPNIDERQRSPSAFHFLMVDVSQLNPVEEQQ
jgi:hypothetical protein